MNNFWQILLFLPTVGALIGYVCKWVAIRLLFVPTRFRGIGPVGWQGVVYRRADTFARGVADTVLESGVTPEAMIAKLGPEVIRKKVSALASQYGDGLFQAVADAVKPGLAAQLPAPIKAQLLAQVEREVVRIADVVARELRPQMIAALAIRDKVIAELSGTNASRLAKLLQTVAARELRIVIYYGAVLGFLIGVVEVGFYTVLERWWLLPIVGAIDGLVNNWLAIQMIFRPREKKRYLGVFPFQGLFPARQDEIARDYASMLAREVLTAEHLWQDVPAARRAELFDAARVIILREAQPMITMMMPMLAGLLGPAAQSLNMGAIAAAVVTHGAAHRDALTSDAFAWLDAELAVEQTMAQALAAMSKDRFERVLRGVFEADEWILIAIGGVLGGAIGLLQGLLAVALQ